jgi:hypothetical protein
MLALLLTVGVACGGGSGGGGGNDGGGNDGGVDQASIHRDVAMGQPDLPLVLDTPLGQDLPAVADVGRAEASPPSGKYDVAPVDVPLRPDARDVAQDNRRMDVGAIEAGRRDVPRVDTNLADRPVDRRPVDAQLIDTRPRG